MKTVITLLLASLAWAQDQSVNISQAPPQLGYERILVYSGSNLTYMCLARSDQRNARTVTVSAASNANPVSFTATAHGFDYQAGATATPVVKITGATLTWAPINGVWIATPTSANAFTIPVDSTTFGALTGTLVVSTLAPKTTDPVWAIQKLVYDGSNNLIWVGWGTKVPGAGNAPLVAGSSSSNLACASRSTYSYQ